MRKPFLHLALTAKRAPAARIVALCVLVALLSSCSPSPLDVAARGELELLKEMLEQDPSIVNYQKNKMRKTPLHHAVTYRKLEVVTFLIDHGANVNLGDVTGMTPLHIAATLNRVDEAKALVRAGANVEILDKFGDRPLHTAAIHGQIRMIEYLIGEAEARMRVSNSAGLIPHDLAVRERKYEAADKLEELASKGPPE